MNVLPVKSDLGHPPASARLMNPAKSAFVTSHQALIMLVSGRRHFTEIKPSIIAWVAIDMVDLYRPPAGHVEERQPMCVIMFWADANDPIAVWASRPDRFAD
jgi:hypothetical protein